MLFTAPEFSISATVLNIGHTRHGAGLEQLRVLAHEPGGRHQAWVARAADELGCYHLAPVHVLGGVGHHPRAHHQLHHAGEDQLTVHAEVVLVAQELHRGLGRWAHAELAGVAVPDEGSGMGDHHQNQGTTPRLTKPSPSGGPTRVRYTSGA